MPETKTDQTGIDPTANLEFDFKPTKTERVGRALGRLLNPFKTRRAVSEAKLQTQMDFYKQFGAPAQDRQPQLIKKLDPTMIDAPATDATRIPLAPKALNDALQAQPTTTMETTTEVPTTTDAPTTTTEVPTTTPPTTTTSSKGSEPPPTVAPPMNPGF